MNLITILLMAFAAIQCLSDHTDEYATLGLQRQRITGNTTDVPARCMSIAGRLTCSNKRLKRSRKGEFSISPPSPPSSPSAPSLTPISRAPKKTNHTSTSSAAPNLQSWTPLLERILTAVFRAVITILTLFNVNFTWRIHGKEKAHRQSFQPMTLAAFNAQRGFRPLRNGWLA